MSITRSLGAPADTPLEPLVDHWSIEAQRVVVLKARLKPFKLQGGAGYSALHVFYSTFVLSNVDMFTLPAHI